MINRKRMKAFNAIVRNSLFWFISEIFCLIKTFGLWSLFVVTKKKEGKALYLTSEVPLATSNAIS